MKRISVLLACAILLVFLSGCGDAPQESSTPPASNSSDSSLGATPNPPYGLDNIDVVISDLKSNLNQWHRFSLTVSHDTDMYLTAEIQGSVLDADGNVLGETTVFVNNLGPAPTDWLTEAFLAKSAPEYFADYSIVSYEFTDGSMVMPEIDDTNINNYLRMTVNDYGDTLNGEKEITVSIHNLTPQYYTGGITFSVKDSQGTILEERTVDIQDLRPYSEHDSLLFFPRTEEYTVEYHIESYQFYE